MRRPELLLLALLFACGAPIEDEVQVTALEEMAHEVEVSLDRGVVEMSVYRALRVAESELTREVPLPTGASLHAFEIAVDGRWVRGDLLDATDASERFDVLAGLGQREAMTEDFAPPALLSWGSEGWLNLEMFPLEPGSLVEMRYALTMAACARDGQVIIDYPKEEGLRPSIHGVANMSEAPDEEWTDFCDEEANVTGGDTWLLELDELGTGQVQAFAHGIQTKEGGLVRLAVDLPRELAEVPVAPTVIFLVDGSISLKDDNLVDQLTWAEAYLDWVPDASVEVVVFHRFAEQLFGHFVPASTFADAIKNRPRYEAQNGSNLDRGLELVKELVAGAGGPVRVVAMSDLELRGDFDEDAAAEILAEENVVLHLVDRGYRDGTPALEEAMRDFDASIPERTGGLLFELSGLGTKEERIGAVESLVRPTRLYIASVEGMGDEEGGVHLERGETLRMVSRINTPPGSVEVHARLWSQHFELPVVPADDEALPAILMGSDMVHYMDEDEVRGLAMAHGLVTPYTSYLAELGGAPLAEIDVGLGGMGGIGLSSIGCACGGCSMRGIRGRVYPDRRGWLAEAVDEALATCGTEALDEISIETTDAEITRVKGEDTCVVEAMWRVRLPDWFEGNGQVTYAFQPE